MDVEPRARPSDIRTRLDELKIRAQRPALVSPAREASDTPVVKAGPDTCRSSAQSGEARSYLALSDLLGGREFVALNQRCWCIDYRFRGGGAPPASENSRFVRAPVWNMNGLDDGTIDATRTLILDIETGGFAGTPVFLIGVVALDEYPLRTIQFLARDYPEEAAILHALREASAGRDTWVTFNGKSFDEPFLRDRAAVHRLALPAPRRHLDLLHAARRAWGEGLPDCRLRTLEQRILGRTRIGDVSSREVPDLFHLFFRTGNAGPLRPVLEHNRLDLVTATELLIRLSTPAPLGSG